MGGGIRGGFTIQNMIVEDNYAYLVGGGIGNNGSGLITIIDSTIQNNTTGQSGGGIAGIAITLINSKVLGNNATSPSTAYGGGIFLGNSGNLKISENSEISENTAQGGGGAYAYGGGIWFGSYTTVILENVKFQGNTAENPGYGGGLYTVADNITITGGDFSGNTATRGGGIYMVGGPYSASFNVSVTGNTATDTGGGIYCAPYLTLNASKVANNTPNDIVNCDSIDPPLGITRTAADNEQSGTDADPINTYTGELFKQYSPDISLGGPMPLYFARYYSSGLKQAGIVGNMSDNWRHNFDWTLSIIGTTIHVLDHHGRTIQFVQNGSAWDLDGKTDIVYQLDETAGVFTLLDPRSQRMYTFTSGRLTGIEDGKGNVLTLTYDAGGRLTDVSDGLGRTLTFTYEADGKLSTVTDGTRTVSFAYTVYPMNDLTQVTDVLGNITTYAYDAGGLMTSWTLPEGNIPFQETFHYETEKTISQTDADGNTFSFDYSGNNTTITDPLGNTRVHSHTSNGEFTDRQDQAGQSFSMGYDATGRRNSITDRLGDTTSVTYHAASGKIASVINADGTTKNYAYTARVVGGVTHYDLTGITHADNTTESFTYDANGNLLSHTDQAGNTLTGTYNANGQPLTATNVAGGTAIHTYNADGTRDATTDPAGNTTTFGYDTLKRLDQFTYADNNTRSMTYDNADNLLTTTDENDNTSTLTYDTNNRLTTFTDALSNDYTYTYDGNNRLLSTTDPLGGTASSTYDQLGRLSTITDENTNIVTLGYNILGRLTSITNPLGDVSSFSYDAEAILTSSTNPLGNTTTFASDQMGRITQTTSPLGNVFGITYDAMGRVATATDPLGNTTTLSWEERGLLSGITLPGGVISATYTRNALGQITTLTDPNGNNWFSTYDNNGYQLTSTDPLGNQRAMAYNNRNRLITVTYPNALDSLALTYDPVGNLTEAAYSDSTTFNYTYDANNRLTGAEGMSRSYDTRGLIINSNGIAITRDTGGRITSMKLATGKNITYTYTANDQVASIVDWVGGSSTFTYDAAGRLTAMTRPNGVTATFSYDADNRLTGINEGVVSSISLVRDANGRITSANRSVPGAAAILSPGTTQWTFDAASQVNGNSYDAMGRLTIRGADTFTWDLATRLTSYTVGGNTVSSAYDALGRRISRTAGGVTRNYIWNDALGLNSISVEAQGGVDQKYYIHSSGGTLLYSIDATSNARGFYHFDEMGNTIIVTNDAGAVIGSYAYTPYGEIAATTGGLDNSFTWQGQFGVMDEGNGLYYMRARYYESSSDRFISRDPVKAISPKGVNPYQYSWGNPMRFVDPSGKVPSQEEVAAAQALMDAAHAALVKAAGIRDDIIGITGRNVRKNSNDPVEYINAARSTFFPQKLFDEAKEVATAAMEEYSRLSDIFFKLEREREAFILHLKDNLDKAREKVKKAKDALNTGGTRTKMQQLVRKIILDKTKAEVIQAEQDIIDAGEEVEPEEIESVIPELPGIIVLT